MSFRRLSLTISIVICRCKQTPIVWKLTTVALQWIAVTTKSLTAVGCLIASVATLQQALPM